jgi:regulatory factor X
LSRASTTSIHSYGQHEQAHDFQPSYTQQPPHANNFQDHQYGQGYVPINSALVQAVQHASQQESMPLDSVHRLMSFSAEPGHHASASPSLPAQPFDPNHAVQYAQGAMSQPQQLVGTPVEIEEKKNTKKGSTTGSATNDKELREMLKANEGRSLEEVAKEVIATASSSKAEKTKQLFAMLW